MAKIPIQSCSGLAKLPPALGSFGAQHRHLVGHLVPDRSSAPLPLLCARSRSGDRLAEPVSSSRPSAAALLAASESRSRPSDAHSLCRLQEEAWNGGRVNRTRLR
ncbi:hypothetical protein VTO73DRAFT_7926 [Trametes versicolor]